MPRPLHHSDLRTDKSTSVNDILFKENLSQTWILFRYLENISTSRFCKRFLRNGQILAIFEIWKNFELSEYGNVICHYEATGLENPNT